MKKKNLFTIILSIYTALSFAQIIPGTSNSGLSLPNGGHTSIILGSPVTEQHGGIIQTSDNRHRIFLGANLYDDVVGGWKNFSPGKGGAGISILADRNGWGTGIAFYVSDKDGFPDDLEKMAINADGNVGIGTNPISGFKLTVGGTILSESVKVQLKGSWPDYVFEPEYQLKPLDKLEQFIRENKHLPNIPSAKELQKDGLDLEKMNVQLLQKIEELTLYIIDLKKDIELLKSR